jgi:N-acetylglucosaminyldiphosphoundecaprenol N-acetyl-beta-D-mannosaminyltransferase
MDVLGIDIDESSRDEIRVRVDGFFHENHFHRIATVNPEFLVEAKRNPLFRDALRLADLRVADGFGVVLAGFFRGKRIDRYPGADLLEYLLAKAEREGLWIFLAVRKDGLSTFEMVREAILKRYPGVRIFGRDIQIGEIGNWKLEIGNSAIVFCNFGAPEQEYFLERLRNE